MCNQSNISIFLSYFEIGFPWSFAMSFWDTTPPFFSFASEQQDHQINNFLRRGEERSLTFPRQVPSHGLNMTGWWWPGVGPGRGQEALQVLRVPGGLPDGRLHLDQVKPGLTELLQGFVGHLQMALKVNSEPDSEEKQARALRQKMTRQWQCRCLYI